MVKELLGAKPDGPGREAFLTRRAGVVETEKCYTLPEENKTFTPPPANFGGLRKAFCLPNLRLSDDLIQRRDIDYELLEFLTAPVTVQMMDPEQWLESWAIA